MGKVNEVAVPAQTPPKNQTARPAAPEETSVEGVRARLESLYNKDTAQRLFSDYADVIHDMVSHEADRVSGFSNEDIVAEIGKLESAVDDYYEIYGFPLSLTKKTVRKWYLGLVKEQSKAGNIKYKKDAEWSVDSQLRIGKDELYSLINANRKQLRPWTRVFNDSPAALEYQVNEQPFMKVFSDRKTGKYDFEGCSVTSNEFRVRSRIAVSKGRSKNPSGMVGLLKVLAANEVMGMPDADIASAVKSTLFDMALKNIDEKYPPTDLKNKDARTKLIKRARYYIYGDAAEAKKAGKKPVLPRGDIAALVGGKKDSAETMALWGGTESENTPFAFLKGFERTPLVQYVAEEAEGEAALVKELTKNKVENVDERLNYGDLKYSIAGRATVDSEQGSLLTLFLGNGGYEDEFTDMPIDNQYVLTATIAASVGDWAAFQTGWTGQTTIGPDMNIRPYINWLHKPAEVEAAVRQDALDKAKFLGIEHLIKPEMKTSEIEGLVWSTAISQAKALGMTYAPDAPLDRLLEEIRTSLKKRSEEAGLTAVPGMSVEDYNKMIRKALVDKAVSLGITVNDTMSDDKINELIRAELVKKAERNKVKVTSKMTIPEIEAAIEEAKKT